MWICLMSQARARTEASRNARDAMLTRGQSLQNDPFDYEENADNDSSLSTPSNSYWDSPFNLDSLGDTVIHLDKVQSLPLPHPTPPHPTPSNSVLDSPFNQDTVIHLDKV